MRSYGKYILCVFCGFLLALTAHSVWGKTASAILGISLAILFACLANADWRYALFLLLLLPCLVGTYSIGLGLGGWFNNNTPEQVLMGDTCVFAQKTGSCFVPMVSGLVNLVRTGNPDSLANSGVKFHHLLILIVFMYGLAACACYAFKHRKRAQEAAAQVETA